MAQETFSLLCIKVTTAQHEAIRELHLYILKTIGH